MSLGTKAGQGTPRVVHRTGAIICGQWGELQTHIGRSSSPSPVDRYYITPLVASGMQMETEAFAVLSSRTRAAALPLPRWNQISEKDRFPIRA